MARMTKLRRRDILAALREVGCYRQRWGGSHEIWKTPGGRTLVIPHKRIHQNVIAQLRGALNAEGLDTSVLEGA